ncbi:hypothetical protein ACO0SA_003346 [Hanseniaspora valbyensis]
MFKRSAFTYGRGVFANTTDVLKNPKQDILFRSLNKELIEHNMIITTGAKAKFINSHFYKIVNKVNEYKKAAKGSEEQKKLILEAKNLLIGNNDDSALKQELLNKVETLLTRWSKRMTENIKSDRFLNVSRLEPRKYDAAPMCLVELKDLPLFNESDLPTYGNLYIWMTLEGLINGKADKIQKRVLFKDLHDYLHTMNKTQQAEFFEKDLMKVREYLARRDFEASAEKSTSEIKSDDINEDIDAEEDNSFKFDSSLYTEANNELETEYNNFVHEMKKKASQKPKANIKDLGKVNVYVRPHLNIVSNFEY